MTKFLMITILCLLCATPFAEMAAAQTSAPEGMVLVPAGRFWMGRTQAVWRDALDVVPRAKMDDRPANEIELAAFYIDKTEVSNEAYAKFVKATGNRAPWHWTEGKVPEGKDKQAVSNVNWY